MFVIPENACLRREKLKNRKVSLSSSIRMDPNDEMTQPDVIEIESAPLSHKILVVVVGLGVGSLMCFSNMYFGLQTGFISMMSLQSALLGYGAFQLLKSTFPGEDFGIGERGGTCCCVDFFFILLFFLFLLFPPKY